MARGIAEQIVQSHTEYLGRVRHVIETAQQVGLKRARIRHMVQIGAAHHLRELHRLSDQFCWLDEDGTPRAAQDDIDQGHLTLDEARSVLALQGINEEYLEDD